MSIEHRVHQRGQKPNLAASSGAPSRRTVLVSGWAACTTLVGCASGNRGSDRAPSLQSRSFDSAGVRIRYVEAGAGELIVLTHGFSSTVENQWIRTGVFDKLAQHYRVIGIDGRGHGLSGKPHEASQYGPQAARDVTRLLDHLGLQKAHIVGYSLGAILNGYLVTQAPERFKTCVLAGATPRFRWTTADQTKLDAEAAEMEQGSKKSQILRLWPKDQPPPSEEKIREMSAKDLEGQDYRALAASRRGGSKALITPAQVAAIRVPTLGVVGTADPYLAEFRAMQALNPAIELVTIDGASHTTAPGRPELAEGILRFLARHRG
jgi:pimeloyl-ACP methyl ester carboxylesterase